MPGIIPTLVNFPGTYHVSITSASQKVNNFLHLQAICNVATPLHERVSACQSPLDCVSYVIISISNSLPNAFIFRSFINRDLTLSIRAVVFTLIHYAFVESLFSNFEIFTCSAMIFCSKVIN